MGEGAHAGPPQNVAWQAKRAFPTRHGRQGGPPGIEHDLAHPRQVDLQDGGIMGYRGMVKMGQQLCGSKARVKVRTGLMRTANRDRTLPDIQIQTTHVTVAHGPTVGVSTTSSSHGLARLHETRRGDAS